MRESVFINEITGETMSATKYFWTTEHNQDDSVVVGVGGTGRYVCPACGLRTTLAVERDLRPATSEKYYGLDTPHKVELRWWDNSLRVPERWEGFEVQRDLYVPMVNEQHAFLRQNGAFGTMVNGKWIPPTKGNRHFHYAHNPQNLSEEKTMWACPLYNSNESGIPKEKSLVTPTHWHDNYEGAFNVIHGDSPAWKRRYDSERRFLADGATKSGLLYEFVYSNQPNVDKRRMSVESFNIHRLRVVYAPDRLRAGPVVLSSHDPEERARLRALSPVGRLGALRAFGHGDVGKNQYLECDALTIQARREIAEFGPVMRSQFSVHHPVFPVEFQLRATAVGGLIIYPVRTGPTAPVNGEYLRRYG